MNAVYSWQCNADYYVKGLITTVSYYDSTSEVTKMTCCPLVTPPPTIRELLVHSCTESTKWSDDYGCVYAHNGNGEWATAGEGVDSWIQYNFGSSVTITSMKFQNRVCTGTCGESRTATLAFSDGSTQDVQFQLRYDVNTIAIAPISTTFVKMTIKQVYNTVDNGANMLTFFGYHTTQAEAMATSLVAANANDILLNAKTGSMWDMTLIGFAFVGLTSIIFQICRSFKTSNPEFAPVLPIDNA